MAFRFRKSLGFGFGRVNLSKGGASLSLGGRGNVINLGRRGARTTFGIPGTGMSWSTKLGGGRLATTAFPSSSEINDTFEAFDDDMTVNEARYHQMELAVAKMETIIADFKKRDKDCVSEEHYAELATAKAMLKARRKELDRYYRTERRVKAALLWRSTKKAIFWGIVLWIMYVMFWAPAHKQAATQPSAVTIEEKVAAPSITIPTVVEEPAPLPRARPRPNVQQ